MPTITKDIPIEDLIKEYPWTVTFLAKKGIMCIQCGEPIWGTLGEAITRKNLDLDDIITELNQELGRN